MDYNANHVHTLTKLHENTLLSKVIQSWKGASSRGINKLLGRHGTLWEKLYMDTIIRDYVHFSNCVRYIRNNPKKANLGESLYTLYESDAVSNINYAGDYGNRTQIED